ncbi:hypothetical protein ACS0TY_020959 [Phlomoides rotata]
MAYTSNTSVFKLVLVLTLVMISVSESRTPLGRGTQGAAALACNTVVGAEGGDTCSSIAQLFGLSLKEFLKINPNINCTAVFVGQWLCIAA